MTPERIKQLADPIGEKPWLSGSELIQLCAIALAAQAVVDARFGTSIVKRHCVPEIIALAETLK